MQIYQVRASFGNCRIVWKKGGRSECNHQHTDDFGGHNDLGAMCRSHLSPLCYFSEYYSFWFTKSPFGFELSLPDLYNCIWGLILWRHHPFNISLLSEVLLHRTGSLKSRELRVLPSGIPVCFMCRNYGSERCNIYKDGTILLQTI